MRLDVVRAVRDDLVELHDGEVLVVVLRIVECLVIALHSVRADTEDRRLPLDLVEVMVRDVILRQQIHTDDPLYERIRGLPTLKKDKAQEISRILLILIECQ